MKIAVIAASGRTGRIFVEAALAAGHSVNAGVRGANPFTPHERLKVLKCDATMAPDILDLIEGCDAVVSLIGHVKGSDPDVQTKATAIIINAMKTRGQKRIVSLTGTGVRFPGDKITFIDKVLNFAVSVADPSRVSDGIAHAALLKESDLHWTLVRVLKLQNISPRPFTLLANGPTKPFVGRKEVAQAILQVLEQESFVQKAPIIAPQSSSQPVPRP